MPILCRDEAYHCKVMQKNLRLQEERILFDKIFYNKLIMRE